MCIVTLHRKLSKAPGLILSYLVLSKTEACAPWQELQCGPLIPEILTLRQPYWLTIIWEPLKPELMGFVKWSQSKEQGQRSHCRELQGESLPALLHTCIPRRAISRGTLMVALEKAVHSTSWTVKTTLVAAGGWQEKTNQIREVTDPSQSPVDLHTLLAGLWYL